MQFVNLYEVASPVARPVTRKTALAGPIPDLKGKKIGFMWTIYTHGDTLADALMDVLGKHFENIETVKLPAGKGRRWGEYPDESIEEVVREAGVDGVVVTVGG
jgi:hypothetical protein